MFPWAAWAWKPPEKVQSNATTASMRIALDTMFNGCLRSMFRILLCSFIFLVGCGTGTCQFPGLILVIPPFIRGIPSFVVPEKYEPNRINVKPWFFRSDQVWRGVQSR